MKKETIVYQSKNFSHFDTLGYLYQLVSNRTLTGIAHKHDFIEIVCVLEGFIDQNIDGETKRLNPLEFTVLSTENTHFFEKQSDNVRIFCLSVLPSKFAKFLNAYEFSPTYGKAYTIKNDRLIKELLRLPTKETSQQILSTHTIIADFFTEMIRFSAPSSTIPDHLQKALEQIKKPENLIGGVKKLAELAGYSRVHLCRLIKTHFGKTAVELLHEIRMKLACEYLENTSFSIELITEKIGLSSVSQFHSAFKSYHGYTPSEYRKKSKRLATI